MFRLIAKRKIHDADNETEMVLKMATARAAPPRGGRRRRPRWRWWSTVLASNASAASRTRARAERRGRRGAWERRRTRRPCRGRRWGGRPAGAAAPPRRRWSSGWHRGDARRCDGSCLDGGARRRPGGGARRGHGGDHAAPVAQTSASTRRQSRRCRLQCSCDAPVTAVSVARGGRRAAAEQPAAWHGRPHLLVVAAAYALGSSRRDRTAAGPR
jgi:hypothetical protein